MRGMRFERLESRDFLAATIGGTVFSDLDTDFPILCSPVRLPLTVQL